MVICPARASSFPLYPLAALFVFMANTRSSDSDEKLVAAPSEISYVFLVLVFNRDKDMSDEALLCSSKFNLRNWCTAPNELNREPGVGIAHKVTIDFVTVMEMGEWSSCSRGDSMRQDPLY
jgi:hypothetical protein